MENVWVHSMPYAQLPFNAVIGGHDADGSPIYVGRSFHEGDNLPAKVIPSKGTAYVAYGGVEIPKSHYEVLVGEGYAWVPCYGGNVPPNAVSTGTTRTGEPLFVGRGHHASSLTVGKIHRSHGCLYIPFGGQEIRINTYEVLVKQVVEQWVASTPNYTPPMAVVAGHDSDRAPIYVGRAMHEAHKWVHSTAYSTIPPNAVLGGNDVDGSVIYVGRSYHNGDMLVAKVIPSKHIAFVSWRGEEIPKDHFEVLCGQNLAWRQCYDHVIPDNAVLCGKTALGQPVYIGRGHYEGSLTVGKVSSVHRALFIPFKGVERRLETYEILLQQKPLTGWAVESPVSPPPPPPPVCESKPCPYPILDEKPPIDVKPPPYTQMPQAPPFGPPQSTSPFAPPAPFDPPPPYMPMPQPMPQGTLTSMPPRSNAQHTWMIASANYIPPNAVYAGHDVDLSNILVCRAFHDGHLVPGKAIPSRGCAFIPFAGQEIPKSNYEVLIGTDYHWLPAQDGNVAPGAVEAGRTNNGEPLFVGRAHFRGSLTPGKIQRSHQCLYIPFGGSEHRITNYEVLVRRSDSYYEQSMKMMY